MNVFIAIKTEPKDMRFLVVAYDFEQDEVAAYLLPENDIDSFKVADIVEIIPNGGFQTIDGQRFNHADYVQNFGPAYADQALEWTPKIRQFMLDQGWADDVVVEGVDAEQTTD